MGEMTNLPLIEHIAKKGKPMIISTGMSEIKDINYAVKIFKKNKCDFILMHCVSNYPCADKDLNLNLIIALKEKFKCKIGYSGHETTVSPSIAAWFLGADYIERHITLDRTMWGTDQMCSVEPQGLIKLVRGVRELEMALGDGVKRVTEKELKIKTKLRK